MMQLVLKLVASVGISLLAGAIGGMVTSSKITSWYARLDKPWFNPPNWVFAPVWTTLYILMGVSLFLVWKKESEYSKKVAYLFFGAQLLLNTLWSLTFFGLERLWLSVVIIFILLIAIILSIREFWKFSHLAAYLLVPYMAWVIFASILNIAVALLN